MPVSPCSSMVILRNLPASLLHNYRVVRDHLEGPDARCRCRIGIYLHREALKPNGQDHVPF
jgi:hypothetical protein